MLCLFDVTSDEVMIEIEETNTNVVENDVKAMTEGDSLFISLSEGSDCCIFITNTTKVFRLLKISLERDLIKMF